MTGDYLKRSRDLDEIYALIDKDRVEVATAAHAKFHNDMEAAIATTASIGSIAGARVLADSRNEARFVYLYGSESFDKARKLGLEGHLHLRRELKSTAKVLWLH